MLPASFPSLLASSRRHRGLSQLALALAAGCSQRHLSFLELGRTRPSREMVLRLAASLEVPLRRSNEMLLAAGYAPMWKETAWTETDASATTFGPIRDALDRILTQQEPYPGVVVDRRWNLLQANKGAVALVAFLAGPAAPGAAINLADALVGPNVLRPHLVNWGDVVRYFVRGVSADAAADGSAETAALLARLLAYDGVRAALSSAEPAEAEGPVLPMYFRRGDVSLRLFTIIATLGTPQDVTLQELRIESFFPIDDATRDFFRRAAASPN